MPKSVKISEEFDSAVLNIAIDTIKIGKQAIVFVNTKKSAEKTAEDISKKLKKDESLSEIADDALNSLSKPTKQCERLSYCLQKGIAFHHAGLTGKQKDIIEDNFRKGSVKIICCTPTLAYGVDLPAFRAIIKDLKRFTVHGLSWIPVLDYMQMSGRAGRPNYDSEGQSIAIALTNSEKEKIGEKYVNGLPEDIYSKLAVEPVLRTYVLSLIAANFITTKKELFEFFDRTFYAHQFKDLRRLHATISKVIDLLDEWEFIIRSGDDGFSGADEIDDEKYKTTLIGKRVAELYIDPLTAYFIITCLRDASDKKLDAFSFLQMISHTLEIRPMLKVGLREHDKIQEQMLELSDYLLEDEPLMYEPEYEDFLNSVKTALMFNQWISEQDEEFLLEEYNIRPGELRAKIDIADWLLYSTEELAKLLHFQSVLKEIVKLRLRLKYGVKEELLALIRLENVGRVRARILFRNRIKDVQDLKSADLVTLTQLLGEKTALGIKKQIGQEQLGIPENKRKGQISLKDWDE
ncbi:MAG TPA: helicase-related protein [Candidatus Nanoarchaeia archaeon]|nr:helicase-related protein [Candidatus Nanoarchaeia archaeon]